MKEKRRHPRLSMNLPVIVRSAGQLHPATMRDLSNGGIGLLTDFTPELNSSIEMIFDISSEIKDVSIMGKIIRKDGNNPSAIGIEFTVPFSHGRTTVKDYLTKAYS